MRKNKAIINTLSSILLQITIIICGLIIPKRIIMVFGSDVNGIITSITKFLSLIILMESGFGVVIKSLLFKPIANKDTKQVEKIIKASEKIFKKISYAFIIYVLFLCIILPHFFKNQFSSWYTLSLIVIIMISTFAEYYIGMTYKLFLQASQKGYIDSIIQIITYIINTIIILALLKIKSNIQLIKGITALIYVIRPILLKIYVKNKYNINIKNIKEEIVLKEKWDGLAQHIAYVIHTNTDILILSLCTRISEVSVYSIYIMIIDGVKKLIQSLDNGIEATFGDMIAKNENEILNKSFKKYEGIYLSVSTIAFVSVYFLIVPFVKIYTRGISDVSYIRPAFASIIVIAEFIFIIRQLYYGLVKVSGDFKQTRNGAIIEAIINILISLILVWKYGITGVAIGTLVAMIIRTIEIICYTNKKILKRSIYYSIKRIIIIIIEFIITYLLLKIINLNEVNNTYEWIKNAFIVTGITTIIVISLNSIAFKENVKEIINFLFGRKRNEK